VRFRERAQAAGSVERLVERAVDLDLFESLERCDLDGAAVDERLARIAVFVDQSFGGPGQRVFQDVVRMLGQGADAHLHGAHLVEVRDELVGGDADEAWRQTALRHEGAIGPFGDAAHAPGHFHVFRQIEVVDAGRTRHFGDTDVAVVREPGDHRIDGMLGDVPGQRFRIGRVHLKAIEIGVAVSTRHGVGGGAIDIAETDFVTT
jgi:hypothetical protein